MEPKDNSNKFIGIIIGIIALVGVAGISFLGGKDKNETVLPEQTSDDVAQNPVSGATPTTPTKTPVSTKPAVSSVYKDGTYTANGTYMSPGGQDTVSVKVTLANDVITSTSITTVVADGTSKRYIDEFASGYKQYVVGKNISSVRLTKVSGSSLTSTGFNNALATIKAQAKV